MLRICCITKPSLVRLGHGTSPGAKNFDVFVFFFVLMSVALLNDKVCERHFAINALEFENDHGAG